NTFNEGWGSLALKVEEFVIRNTDTQGFTTSRGTIVGKGNYKEALHKSKLNQKELEAVKEDSMLKTPSNINDNDFLRRFRIRRFSGERMHLL
ncbi:hypothetical protein HAX54_004140, partial [Datura stramonium]|nr:hypothetical protein [Datura stramonium]